MPRTSLKPKEESVECQRSSLRSSPAGGAVDHEIDATKAGNSAYLLDLADGRALAVDATREARRLRQVAEERGLRPTYTADTYLHADFLTGTAVPASAAGDREHFHTALADGDQVDLDGLTLRTLAAPGHTQEHVTFELLHGARTLGVLTRGPRDWAQATGRSRGPTS